MPEETTNPFENTMGEDNAPMVPDVQVLHARASEVAARVAKLENQAYVEGSIIMQATQLLDKALSLLPVL